ncbi:hypothetical protein B0H63DRAFT_530921 [Podospora didyma]|uniref:Uncharacterized protein n=1 Tax=Podospora didyma TaxID=330526 RepID=A0AAE0P4L2_9PEZI|nr:hypothetical protein B0H63DRAFT_530921 [Podospora didyma]
MRPADLAKLSLARLPPELQLMIAEAMVKQTQLVYVDIYGPEVLGGAQGPVDQFKRRVLSEARFVVQLPGLDKALRATCRLMRHMYHKHRPVWRDQFNNLQKYRIGPAADILLLRIHREAIWQEFFPENCPITAPMRGIFHECGNLALSGPQGLVVPSRYNPGKAAYLDFLNPNRNPLIVFYEASRKEAETLVIYPQDSFTKSLTFGEIADRFLKSQLRSPWIPEADGL